MSGVMIAALKSGSGKTTITCALLEALKKYGRPVSSFKCGPDYIDPMFHEKVLEIPSRNLDTFFSDKEQIQQLYSMGRRRDEISVVEGVMGLFDGLGGIREEGSAYHLAQTLDIPIILVVDAHGMGRTIVPLLAGIIQYDSDKRIAGFILNRTSKIFYQTIAPVIEQELKVPVVGFFPKIENFQLESRHLGLKLPHEIVDLQEQVKRAAELIKKHVNVDKIIEIADQGGQKEFWEADKDNDRLVISEYCTSNQMKLQNVVRIAVAQDEAFCFYYKDNLRMLEEAGAELVYFSPIHDGKLPEGIRGILLGGGYPELVAEQLSRNLSMKQSIMSAIQQGVPSIAECGGFMYLHEFLVDEQGRQWPMVGAIAGNCSYQGKLVRFGYIEVEEFVPCFLSGNKMKAHEFHYYDSTDNGSACRAVKPVSGKKWDCIHSNSKCWWGFPHLYYPSNPAFVDYFVEQCRH